MIRKSILIVMFGCLPNDGGSGSYLIDVLLLMCFYVFYNLLKKLIDSFRRAKKFVLNLIYKILLHVFFAN